MSEKRFPFFAFAVVLAVVLIALLLRVNAHEVFHASLYENGDAGANSLSVLRAEHLHELYGPYSRWEFHHPGPALFYTFAFGEWLFYQVFHLVPTPYNAQIITVVILNVGFFAAGIGVAARWVRGWVFVPLALGLAVVHFTAVDPQFCVFYPWTAFLLTMPCFALVAAAASVGAGQGDDLPLLVLAGGFAVHLHVAQPFFVGPAVVLAYAGLAWNCRRSSGGMPWRVYPWAHRLAAGLAAVFALPLLVDLCFGSRSNAALILQHMHSHHGEHQPWLDALYCFLRFGVYKPSQPGNLVSPGHVTAGQIGQFLLKHPEMTALWLGALLVLALAFVCRRRIPPGTVVAATVPRPHGRWRFLGWLAAVWLLVTGLTITWNHLQDGEMFYFNSWFTYALYFVLAVLAAGALDDLAETAAARSRHPRRWTVLAATLCVLGTVVFLSRQIGRYRTHDYDDELSRAAARTVDAALAARRDAPRVKLLAFPQDGWAVATGVAVRLVREGQPCLVPPNWHIMFGDDHAAADLYVSWLSGEVGNLPVDIWHIVPANTMYPAQAALYPLVQGYALLPGLPALDPALPDAILTFIGEPHNSASFVLSGWSVPGPNATSAWTTGKAGILAFAPAPVPSNSEVEVDFDFLSAYTAPGKPEAQRLTLRFNGHDLGTLLMDAKTPQPLKAYIPAAVWNQRAAAVFALGFPDAVSPLEAGESDDVRQLAFATVKITFRLATAREVTAAP